MSKGEIVDAKGEGLYTVKLKYAVDQVKAEIEELEQRLSDIDSELPEKESALSDAEGKAESKADEINALIPLYQEDPDAHRAAMTELQAELVKLKGEAQKIRGEVERLKAEKLSATKRKAHLERIPEEKELDCWCADHTEDLFGEVGLIDVNDEGGKLTLVHPGHEGQGFYNPERDGILMPREAQSGAQAWFNAAILPGIQKFAARYRLGEITAIDGDTCTVKLDPAKSSAQNLNINQKEVLENVPAEYMTCGMSVFEIADRVVVRIENGPAVVGFESNPRPCYTNGVLVMPYSDSCTAGFGFPWETEDGQPINNGLGTCGGHSPNAIFTYRDGSPEVQLHTSTQAGMHYWTGWDGKSISTGRYSTGISFVPTSFCHVRGKTYASPEMAPIIGACLFSDKPVIVCEGVNVYALIENQWQLLTSYAPLADSETNGWFFNKSGTKARAFYKRQAGDTTQEFTVCTLTLTGSEPDISASISSEVTEHKGIHYAYEESVSTESGAQKIGDEPTMIKRYPFPEEEMEFYAYMDPPQCVLQSPTYAVGSEGAWIVCENNLDAELEKVRANALKEIKKALDEEKSRVDWYREEYSSGIDKNNPYPWVTRFFSQDAQEALGETTHVTAWRYSAFASGSLYALDEDGNEYESASAGMMDWVWQYLSPRFMVDGSGSVTKTTKRWHSEGGTALAFVGYDQDEEVDIVIEAKDPLTLERVKSETSGRVEGWVYERKYLEKCDPDDERIQDGYYIRGERNIDDLDSQGASGIGLDVEWGPKLGGYKVLVNGAESETLGAPREGDQAFEPPLVLTYMVESDIAAVQAYGTDNVSITKGGNPISPDPFDSIMFSPTTLNNPFEWEGFLEFRSGLYAAGSGVIVDSEGGVHVDLFGDTRSYKANGERYNLEDLYPMGSPGPGYKVKLIGKI